MTGDAISCEALRMRRLGAILGVVGSLSLFGCPPQEVVPDPDAYVLPPPDAYTAPLPDAGPPTCAGRAATCNEQTATTCTDVAGCRLVRCTGESSCELLDRESCSLAPGCYYRETTGCEGVPPECETLTDSGTCGLVRCSWDFSGRGRCMGSATQCGELSGAACTDQPGCTSLVDAGAPDAGPADAGRDAGPPDTGPPMLCTVTGSCDPVVPATCPSTAVCVSTSTMGTYCAARGANLAEGMRCTVRADCRPGLLCGDGRGGRACMRPCRTGRSDCGAGSVCGEAVEPLDPCLRLCMQSCDLYENDCPTGETCVHFSPARGEPAVNGCINPGFSEIGESCLPTSCVRGASCVDSVCRQLCRTTAECTTGECVEGASGISTCT